jgi:hypothetical protein
VYIVQSEGKQFACKEYFKRLDLFQNEVFILSRLEFSNMVFL